MKIVKDGNVIACFSELADGDLAFYLMSEPQIDKIWSDLPVVKQFNLLPPAFASQVHGDRIISVTAKTAYNQGSADSLITGLKNQPVGVFSADCLPLLIFNQNGCASVHAGWRGTRLDIARKTVETFSEKFGQSADSLKACIGPCIGQCCLEMGDEVYEEFVNADNEYAQFFVRREKWHLNLRGLNRFQLLRAGLRSENIIDQEDCTFCKKKEFFSFRRQRQRNGSMFSFVVNCDAN